MEQKPCSAETKTEFPPTHGEDKRCPLGGGQPVMFTFILRLSQHVQAYLSLGHHSGSQAHLARFAQGESQHWWPQECHRHLLQPCAFNNSQWVKSRRKVTAFQPGCGLPGLGGKARGPVSVQDRPQAAPPPRLAPLTCSISCHGVMLKINCGEIQRENGHFKEEDISGCHI